MLEARGDEDGDGAYDHGDLARSLPDLVLRSRVLGRGNLGRRRHPVRAGSQSPHDQRSLRERPRGNTVKPLRPASPIMCGAKTMPAKNDRFSMGKGQLDMNILAAVIDCLARAPSFLLSPVAMIGNSSSLSHRPLVPIPQYIR